MIIKYTLYLETYTQNFSMQSRCPALSCPAFSASPQTAFVDGPLLPNVHLRWRKCWYTKNEDKPVSQEGLEICKQNPVHAFAIDRFLCIACIITSAEIKHDGGRHLKLSLKSMCQDQFQVNILQQITIAFSRMFNKPFSKSCIKIRVQNYQNKTTLCLKEVYHPTTNDNFNNRPSCRIPVIFGTNITE